MNELECPLKYVFYGHMVIPIGLTLMGTDSADVIAALYPVLNT
jgi:hypothetical protein